MKTLMAGPAGAAQPGQVIERSLSECEALVAGRFAEWVERPAPVIETATAEPPRNAALPRPARRKRG